MQRPDPSEYHEYYRGYVENVPEGDILSLLQTEVVRTRSLLERVPPKRENYAYAPGKWSVKDVVGHLIDSERMFGYRALCFARNDPARLPSFEQDHYSLYSNASRRPLGALMEELECVRRSHIALFKSFDEAASARRGIASDVEFSVRALPYIIAGHEIHHRRVLEKHYLPEVW